jgi:hypothetical protein
MALRLTVVNRAAGVARKHGEPRGETVGREAEELAERATLHAIEHGGFAIVAGHGDAPVDRVERGRLQRTRPRRELGDGPSALGREDTGDAVVAGGD